LFAASLTCRDAARLAVSSATTDTCSFLATVTSNGSPYATGPMSCLSVTLVYCGQKVGWINMPLDTVGTEVGLGPGDIVLDRNPAPLPTERGVAAPPLFGICLLWPNGRPAQQLLSSCYKPLNAYAWVIPRRLSHQMSKSVDDWC